MELIDETPAKGTCRETCLIITQSIKDAHMVILAEAWIQNWPECRTKYSMTTLISLLAGAIINITEPA
jgi:hypothetical protein